MILAGIGLFIHVLGAYVLPSTPTTLKVLAVQVRHDQTGSLGSGLSFLSYGGAPAFRA